MKVAEIAKQGSFDAVVCYNEHALSAFRELGRTASGIARVLDVSASMKPYHAEVFLKYRGKYLVARFAQARVH